MTFKKHVGHEPSAPERLGLQQQSELSVWGKLQGWRGPSREVCRGDSRGSRKGLRATASGDTRNREAAARWAGGSSREQREEDVQEGDEQLLKPSRKRSEMGI